jgi:hypothetical protein
MSLKLLEDVYKLDKNDTTPTEQAVLVALAYRANDKTRLCFPKQETIAAMTHLSRSTIQLALNSLREHGFIEWKSGGLTKKRGKYGQPLANDYKLNIPRKNEKSGGSGSLKVMHSDRQPDITMTDSKTLQCPTVRHCNDRPSDTAMTDSRTPTEITTTNTTKISNRKGSGSESRLDSALDEMCSSIGRDMGGRRHLPRQDENRSPLLRALKVCGCVRGTQEYVDNYRSFSSVMLKLGVARSMEAVMMFESEMRQGEHTAVRRPAAVLMSRLTRLL